MNFLRFKLWKLFAIYVLALAVVSVVFWWILSFASPSTSENLQSIFFTNFDLRTPPEILMNQTSIGAVIVVLASIVVSIAVLLANIYFEAVITAKIIRPKPDIRTSTQGVLSTSWDREGRPYILTRMINASKYELVNLRIDAVLTVEEISVDANGNESQFVSYFPVGMIDPVSVFILRSRTPWTISVVANQTLSNSIVAVYELHVGKPIKTSMFEGRKLKRCCRKVEFLITGNDTESSSMVTVHKEVVIDCQEAGKYTLMLHEGRYKNLSMHVDDLEDINRFEEG